MLDFLGLPNPSDLWDRVVDFFTVSAFWYYLFWGTVIALGLALLGWLFPVLRSVTSAGILAIAGMLFAYRRGEKDAEQRERARRQKAQQRQRRQEQQQPWKWPWDN